MIFTNCVSCDAGFAVSLNENYIPLLHEGRQLITTHYCTACGTRNYLEHRRLGGETFGDDDPRAKGLLPIFP